MGYTTDFEGQFELDRQLDPEHAAYLRKFSDTRRMKRDRVALSMTPDPVRRAVLLPLGDEGEYFVGATGWAGQDHDDSIIDYNQPPTSQPGLWCQWVPTEDDDGIEWNGAEKFYDYVEWLQYLIDHFLKPWGYRLNGSVKWSGEEVTDIGLIDVKDNVVHVYDGTHRQPACVTFSSPTISGTKPEIPRPAMTANRDEQADLKILADAFFKGLFFNDWCEYGSPSLDCKRPFGNSNVEGDILELLDAEQEGDDGDGPCWSSKQRKYAADLYRVKLVPYLKNFWNTHSKEIK